MLEDFKIKYEEVEVDCKCRLQEDGYNMVEYDACNEWYHSTCEEIDIFWRNNVAHCIAQIAQVVNN